MQDVTYTELIILEYNEATDLADARYDGEIDILDVTQIELIILGTEKELTFIDPSDTLIPAAQEIITIIKPVENIAILMSPSAEVLRSIDAKNKIVGVGTHIKDEEILFPELSQLPGIGTWVGPGLDYEAILNLDIDLFLAFVKSPQYVDQEKLPGVTVIGMNLRTPEGFAERVKLLGYLVDKKDEAEEYINWHTNWINEIKSKTELLSEDEKPRVFHWSFFQPDGKYQTVSENGRIHQMCDNAGGNDIAEGLPGSWPEVDAEWIVTQNPEIIIAQSYSNYISGGYNTDDPSEMTAARDNILYRPELAQVTAVQNEDVYMMAFLDIATGGSGCLIGTAYMAKWFHPELFEDLDPQVIHQEYLTEFQELDYDLNEHGVFIYPPLE